MKKVFSLEDLKNLFKNQPMNIGILGGTFNPAHAGHLAISNEAIKFYKFDYVIWMVAKQNPFKEKNINDIFYRANESINITQKNPKIIVSTIENDFNCYHTYDSINNLLINFPSLNFTWLMGIDNMEHFDKWYKYQEILNLCNIIVFDRPCKNRLDDYSYLINKMKASLDKNKTHSIIIHRGILHEESSSRIRSQLKI